jgi:predicted transcriptional regulator
MKEYTLTDNEYRFAELVWKCEPIASGDLVKLCEEKFGWKKSTTYTVLKKLCVNRILKNEESTVIAIIKRKEYHQIRSEEFIGDNYGGSLPKFIAAFMDRRKFTKNQIEEIKEIIDSYKEDM